MSVASWLAGRVVARARGWSFEQATARGRLLGHAAYRLDRRHRQTAVANLERAFPDRDGVWHRRTAQAAYEQAGRTLAELLWSPNLERVGPDTVAHLQDVENVREALRRGRGALIISAHFGNWELMALLLGQAGIPLMSIARPLDDRGLEGLLHGLRTGTGNGVLPKVNAVRGALRALRDGKAVAILVDQNTQRHEAVFVPYFGRLAATTPIAAHLHLRSGAPVLPTFVIPEGSGYRLRIEPPVEATATDRDAAVTEITAKVTARIEHHVRAHPEAWLWMHDRWRERPAPGGGQGEV